MSAASTVWKLEFVTADLAAAEFALEEFGATTWSNEQTHDSPDAPWRFGIYFEGEPDISALMLPQDAVPQLAPLPNRDWVSESQENLPPVRIPPFYLHGSHDAPHGGGWLNIEMQAGLAFGSGHHGTTQGCVYLLAELLKHKRPQSVADIGCGSGTLAIAAARAGLANSEGHILASDNDPIAVRVTRENMKLNGVAPRISAFSATGMAHPAYHGRRFDLIFANIMALPLIKLAADFDAHLAYDGRLILSGLMNEQARKVLARYRACGFKVERKKVIGQWTSLCLKR